MPTKLFVVVVKGSNGGQLTNVEVKLEGKDVPLGSGDSVTWRNDGINITYTGKLAVYYKIQAITGTTWEISVKEKGADKPCFSASGTTGNDGKANVSEKTTEGDC